jgi:hypothetical protein
VFNKHICIFASVQYAARPDIKQSDSREHRDESFHTLAVLPAESQYSLSGARPPPASSAKPNQMDIADSVGCAMTLSIATSPLESEPLQAFRRMISAELKKE